MRNPKPSGRQILSFVRHRSGKCFASTLTAASRRIGRSQRPTRQLGTGYRKAIFGPRLSCRDDSSRIFANRPRLVVLASYSGIREPRNGPRPSNSAKTRGRREPGFFVCTRANSHRCEQRGASAAADRIRSRCGIALQDRRPRSAQRHRANYTPPGHRQRRPDNDLAEKIVIIFSYQRAIFE